MIDYIKKLTEKKSVLILGFGREGKSTLNILKKADTASKISVADANNVDVLYEDVDLICGKNYLSVLDDYDVVFKSPGVVLPKAFEEYKCKITSQVEVFFNVYKDRIIGITGTKGKSTTTTLLYKILQSADKKVVLAGNIGIPVFEIYEEMKEDVMAVVELSCHQLEYIDVGAKYGIYLNLHEEHLDHYKTMEKYTHAKENIYRYQDENATLYCLDSLVPQKDCASKVIALGKGNDLDAKEVDYYLCDGSIYYNDEDGLKTQKYVIPTEQIKLLGEHNYFDIAFVYAVCRDLGVSDEDFTKGLIAYDPLPHRLQFVGKFDDIKWYDDSISTIDETTIQALNTLKDADTVIIGGMDRGISYEKLEKFLNSFNIPNIILMEATGKRIFEEMKAMHFKDIERVHLVEHLEDAVELAKKITAKQKSCVMSPAAASYGIFKNFEDRGETFCRLVSGK